MNLQEWRKHFREQLAELYPPSEADWLFFLFLEKEESISKEKFFMYPETGTQSSRWPEILRRLCTHEPWQYVAGETEWAGLNLLTKPGILIPRPETEELAYLIHRHLKNRPPRRILDVATGTGALALALKKFFPAAQVFATDYRDDILDTARRNARHNALEIQILKYDLLREGIPAGPWDLVVSNPPYVLPSERRKMEANVLDYEPHDALFVPENDPLVFYKKIMDEFILHASRDAVLYFEINPLTRHLLESEARTRKLKTAFYRDLQGKWRFGRISRKGV